MEAQTDLRSLSQEGEAGTQARSPDSETSAVWGSWPSPGIPGLFRSAPLGGGRSPGPHRVRWS